MTKNNNEIILKNEDETYIAIPNGIIEISNAINSYAILTYLFLVINKNLLGKVNSSILFLQECYIDDKKENQKSKATKIDKILSCLYLFSNTIVDSKKKVICESVIDIPKYSDYFNHCEFQIDKAVDIINIEKKKLYDKYQRFPQYTLSIEVYKNISGKFTVLSLKEYLIIMNYCLKNKHKEKMKVDTMLNIYLLLKMKINRNQALNKAFPNGWLNKEVFTIKSLSKISSVSETTLRKYLESLVKLKLIEKNICNNETFYKLKEELKND